MNLTIEVLKPMSATDVVSCPVSDFAELSMRKEELRLAFTGLKLENILTKINSYLLQTDEENGSGRIYHTPEGEEKSYISLNDLRVRVEEKGRKIVDEGLLVSEDKAFDNFTLGRDSWRDIIKHLGIGFSDGSNLIIYEDLDECYKAINTKTGALGFNLNCIDKFWDEFGERMLRIKAIVDAAIEEEIGAKREAQQAKAKRSRAKERNLRGV